MKKLFIILFTVAIASVNSMAQEPVKQKQSQKSPAERAENMTKRLTKELNLTADQQIKAKAIILKREQDRDNNVQKAKGAHAKTKAEFKTFLSEEQFKKYEEKEAEMKKKREERRKQGPPPPNGTPPPAQGQK
ncbi:hypothetical protein BH10BAC1_BH10BAC1_13360 [soil metagenome]